MRQAKQLSRSEWSRRTMARLGAGFPAVGKQVAELVGGLGHDPVEHVLEVGAGVDLVTPGA